MKKGNMVLRIIKKRNNRLSSCEVCGKPVFKIRANLKPYGERIWWHEDFNLDVNHEASPNGKIRVRE